MRLSCVVVGICNNDILRKTKRLAQGVVPLKILGKIIKSIGRTVLDNKKSEILWNFDKFHFAKWGGSTVPVERLLHGLKEQNQLATNHENKTR
jgi:hypothetical protein